MKDFYPAFCLLFLWLIRSCSKLILSVVKTETWDDVRRFLWSFESVQISLITSVQVLSRLLHCLLIVRRKRSKLRSINKQVCNLHINNTRSESLRWFKNKKEEKDSTALADGKSIHGLIWYSEKLLKGLAKKHWRRKIFSATYDFLWLFYVSRDIREKRVKAGLNCFPFRTIVQNKEKSRGKK